MPADKLVFLHLSDIHFRKSYTGSGHDLDDDLRNEVERDIGRIKDIVKDPFAGVLVTGDVAFSGQKEEYDYAKAWLQRLSALVGCAEQSVWTVPGNHDVDRQKVSQGQLQKSFRRELRACSLEDLDELIQGWMGDTNAAQLLGPIKQYSDFAASFECDVGLERLSWTKNLSLNDGSTLRLIGLNSVLVSDSFDDDQNNKLLVGSAQCRMEREDGVEYLLMCHHPPKWLRDGDRFSDHTNSRSHLQLFGHMHTHKVERINETVRVYSGALHPYRKEKSWQPRYNLLTCSVQTTEAGRRLRVELYSRVYDEPDTRFVADRTAEGNEVRVYEFTLPAWGGKPTPSSPVAIPTIPSPKGKTDVPTGTVTVTEPTVAEVIQLDSIRRLTYRFLNLPFSKRLNIAFDLSLVRDEDAGADEMELYRRFFERARSENKIADLWDKVEAEYTDKTPGSNPFRQ